MTPRLPAVGRSTLLAVLLAGTMALGLGACGRRGRPEAPPDPNAPAKAQTDRSKPATGKAATTRGSQASSSAQGASSSAGTAAQPSATTLATRPNAATTNDVDDDEEADEASTAVSPQPTPAPASRRRDRSYQVPKEPFILDPLL